MLAARRAGANLIVQWSSAADVAAVVSAVHTAGWNVGVISGQTGEDPLVRQRLVAHPDWLRSLRFVSSRITAEVGPKPFARFRAHLEAKLGVQKVGMQQDGRDVVQPPDWAMYPYDSLNLVVEALTEAGSLGAPLMRVMNAAHIVGANGDGRGYNRDLPRGHLALGHVLRPLPGLHVRPGVRRPPVGQPAGGAAAQRLAMTSPSAP